MKLIVKKVGFLKKVVAIREHKEYVVKVNPKGEFGIDIDGDIFLFDREDSKTIKGLFCELSSEPMSCIINH